MANYNQVSYGSTDKNTVKTLQELLNKNGASLTVDGIFGNQTQQAVKKYQQDNNLTVDGIAGNQTWGALTKAQTPAGSVTNTPTQTEEKAPAFAYEPYKPSDTVTQAEALLQQQLANKPGAYQSTWQDQLKGVLQKILNREDFSYDLNGDALYQLYKDRAVTNGELAMMDAMGQAATMTGGFGNSFSQQVGQQAFQRELQGLNDKIPELYQLALDKHTAEGDALRNNAAILAQMEDQDYGRHRDQVADFNTELGRLTEDARYKAEQDYGKWADGQNFGYQMHRDQVADQQWQAQFDEAKRQYDEQMGLSKSKSSGGSSGGRSSSGSGGGYTAPDGWTEEDIKNFQSVNGLVVDGIWGAQTDAKFNEVGDNRNSISPIVQDINPSGFNGSTYGEAVAYLKAKGGSASGLMTQSEWTRHKNQNNSAGGEHEAESYEEYLRAYIWSKLRSGYPWNPAYQ